MVTTPGTAPDRTDKSETVAGEWQTVQSNRPVTRSLTANLRAQTPGATPRTPDTPRTGDTPRTVLKKKDDKFVQLLTALRRDVDADERYYSGSAESDDDLKAQTQITPSPETVQEIDESEQQKESTMASQDQVVDLNDLLEKLDARNATRMQQMQDLADERLDQLREDLAGEIAAARQPQQETAPPHAPTAKELIHNNIDRARRTLRDALRPQLEVNHVSITDANLDALIADEVGGTQSAALGSSNGRTNYIEKMKKEDLMTFDGSRVHIFIRAIDTALLQFTPNQVCATVIRNLEGNASSWWMQLLDRAKVDYMEDTKLLKNVLKKEFAEAAPVLKERSSQRVWKYHKETAMAYYYDKVELLREAYGTRLDEEDICHEVMLGLPDDLQLLINLGRSPKLDNLKQNLQSLEPKYLSLKPEKKASASRSAPSSAPIKATSSTQPSGRRPSLKDTYNPKNISQTPSPNDPSKTLRTYTLPDGTSIQMTRNCNKCNAPHFTFEHNHLQGTKQKASNLTIEGYPVISDATRLSPEMMGQLFAVDEESPPVTSGSDSTSSSKRSKN